VAHVPFSVILAEETLVMDETKLFIDLGLSIAVGLLVGLQRERAGSAIAGIRTFSLISLGGAVAASLPPNVAPWAVVAGLLAVRSVLGSLPRSGRNR